MSMFVLGFAAGWAVRSTVDSSRSLVVGVVATAYGTAERVKRAIAMEREHLEDLVAEGRARFESEKARRAAAGVKRAPVAPVAAVPRAGQAA